MEGGYNPQTSGKLQLPRLVTNSLWLITYNPTPLDLTMEQSYDYLVDCSLVASQELANQHPLIHKVRRLVAQAELIVFSTNTVSTLRGSQGRCKRPGSDQGSPSGLRLLTTQARTSEMSMCFYCERSHKMGGAVLSLPKV